MCSELFFWTKSLVNLDEDLLLFPCKHTSQISLIGIYCFGCCFVEQRTVSIINVWGQVWCYTEILSIFVSKARKIKFKQKCFYKRFCSSEFVTIFDKHYWHFFNKVMVLMSMATKLCFLFYCAFLSLINEIL